MAPAKRPDEVSRQCGRCHGVGTITTMKTRWVPDPNRPGKQKREDHNESDDCPTCRGSGMR